MKAAIVGMGRMGKVHLDALLQLGHHVVAVADNNIDTARDSVGHLPVPPPVFSSASDLLTATDPELLCIATTADSHASILEEALADPALTHLFCEKPYVTVLTEAQRLNLIAEQGGKKIGLNHQMRFMNQYRVVQKEIASGRLGDFVSMTVCAPNFGWANNCSHYIEAFLWLVGEPISGCQAWLEPGLIESKRGPDFRDHAGQALFWTKDRKRLYLDFGSDLGQGLVCIYGFKSGRIVIDEGQATVDISGRKEGGNLIPTTHYGFEAWSEHSVLDSYSLEDVTASSIDALLRGEDFADGNRGAEIVECLVAGVESSRNNSQIVLLEDIASLPIAVENFRWA